MLLGFRILQHNQMKRSISVYGIVLKNGCSGHNGWLMKEPTRHRAANSPNLEYLSEKIPPLVFYVSLIYIHRSTGRVEMFPDLFGCLTKSRDTVALRASGVA